MNKRAAATAALVGLCALSITARVVWELVDPLRFQTVKSAIYWRDVATLGPAVLFGLFAILRAPRARAHNRSPRAVVSLCVAFAVVSCALIAHFVLLGTPAVVDEAAYLWQAELLSNARLWADPDSARTLVQYVADIGDKRVSAFFPGSALPLAVGHWTGAGILVGPVLAGAWVGVTYWSARRLFDTKTAVLTVTLAATSPFLLFQGASFFGQVWTALLTVPAVTLALTYRRRLDAVLVGALLSAVCFSRPVSGVVAAVVVGVFWFVTATPKVASRRILLSLLSGAPLLLLFVWMNKALTGHWLTTAHRLLLPDEQPVLGMNVVRNVVLNTAGMAVDASGLVLAGLALAALATWKLRRRPVALALGAYAVAQVLAYAFYYNHGISYGPRYLFEVLAVVSMLTAMGIRSVRAFEGKVALVALLAGTVSLVGVAPARAMLFNDRARYLDLTPVERSVGPGRSLVLVAPGPMPYPDPFYPAFVRNGPEPESSRVLYLRAQGVDACAVAREHPGRAIWALWPDRRLDGADTRPYLEPVLLPPTCKR